MKTISLIGSTGSIGKQVCNVVRRHPDKFKIESIVANASAEAFLRQVQEFKPRYASLVDEEAGKKIADQIPAGVQFAYGKQSALDGVCYGDIAVISATGFAGLEYSLKAIEQKKDIALGISNMVAETIAMLAVFAARSFGIKDVVLTGNLTTLPSITHVFEGLEKNFGVRFLIPDHAQFATVIGAALCDEQK